MDAKTLEALKASIAKWERNAEADRATSYRTSPSDCPLCDLFFREECQGCPVSERTGRSKCDGTPYDDAHRAKVRWYWGVFSEAEQYAHAAARDEVAFLKSLLPEETP